MKTKSIPKDKAIDSTMALMREGYGFISKRCDHYQTDIFETRLMLQNAICIRGAEAAQLFYDTERFKRKGAMPKRIQESLVGKRGVQTLDGEAHRRRKAMFMQLMSPPSIDRLKMKVEEYWRYYLKVWEKEPEVTLHAEVQEILCRAACEWVGVPLKETEIAKRACDMGAMIDAFGAVGPRHWKGRMARNQSEKWMQGIIEDVRHGRLYAEEETALQVFAMGKDQNGAWLDKEVAAVEILNLIRPIVAIAYYISFIALALHDYPQYRELLRTGKIPGEWFVQEVRRLYPFTPFVGARVRKEFKWQGYRFPKDMLVILDVHGIDHDPRIWKQPEIFLPERFGQWQADAYNFIPQGGGDHNTGHRCAGEWITIEIMNVALEFLAERMDYDVPEQDLGFSLSRLPALPRSGFIMREVKSLPYVPVTRIKETRKVA